jgi:hypothetical protein
MTTMSMPHPHHESSSVPHGSGYRGDETSTAEQIGQVYGDALTAAMESSLSKRASDAAELAGVPNESTPGTHTSGRTP